MLAGELEVALVVEGDAHDGARPVLHEHVGSHEAGDLLAVHRIHRVDAERDPLSRHRLVSLRGLGSLQPVLEILDRFSGPPGLGQLAHQWVLWSEREERDAPQGIGPGGENRHTVARLCDLEGDFGAVRPPDPVPLQGEDTVGPLEPFHVVEQPVGVVGDLEEPLDEVSPDHRRATPLAPTLDHLLVGQDGLVFRAPVGGGQLPVSQALLEQFQEEPLRPPIELGVARGQLP